MAPNVSKSFFFFQLLLTDRIRNEPLDDDDVTYAEKPLAYDRLLFLLCGRVHMH